jgi:hypothetical protein
MAEQKSLPLTETAEFKAAVAEAVAKAAPAIVAATVAEMSKSASNPLISGADDDMRKFFSTMALQIAEISDQGTNRKRVAPEILAQRAIARDRCHELLTKARREKLKPEYRVVAKIYINDRLIEPFWRPPGRGSVPRPQEIIWTGMPNEGMRPLNDVAIEIYNAYKESIGSTERITSIKGAHGGIVAPDNRPVWMTPGGLIVKGDPPPKAFVATPVDWEGNPVEVSNNDDPNAEFVQILGTIHAPAKRNQTLFPAEAGQGNR